MNIYFLVTLFLLFQIGGDIHQGTAPMVFRVASFYIAHKSLTAMQTLELRTLAGPDLLL